MRVTLDIFSGRPNPSWVLEERDAQELISRLAGKRLASVDAVEAKLGFRGYIVSSTSDDDETATAAGLPQTFRVGPSELEGLASPTEEALPPLSAPETDELDDWLLSTSVGEVDDGLLAFVAEDIKRRRAPDVSTEEAQVTAAPCVVRKTPYNPGYWNNDSFVRGNNNCYNYAMNDRTDTFAQPGRISGHPNNVMQCSNVAAAANFDGCTTSCSGEMKRVALVVWPGRDYHWYRLHSEDFWGHKPGSTPARNTDNSGRVIGGGLTPANCNRGPYTQFCGYRWSPRGMQVR
jgi:hypothetical protein